MGTLTEPERPTKPDAKHAADRLAKPAAKQPTKPAANHGSVGAAKPAPDGVAEPRAHPRSHRAANAVTIRVAVIRTLTSAVAVPLAKL